MPLRAVGSNVMQRMRIIRALVVVLLLAVGFAFGLKLGVHAGQQQFVLKEGSVRAALLVHELRALRSGETKKLIEAKEVELDGEIVKALSFRDAGLPWLFWPLDGAYEHTRYLRSAALYRSEYPASVSQLQIGGENPFAAEMKSYSELVRQRTKDLLRDYAK